MSKKSESKKVSRRNFLGIAWGGMLGIVGIQSMAALLSYIKPVMAGGFGGLVYAGKVEEFEIGSVNYIMAGRAYLTRTEDGFLAVWQKCTHLGCAVPWVAEENQFHCPCHGSLYTMVGEVIGGPAPRPMDTFPVTIKSGEVWIDTGQPTERSSFDKSQITGA